MGNKMVSFCDICEIEFDSPGKIGERLVPGFPILGDLHFHHRCFDIAKKRLRSIFCNFVPGG